MSNASSTATKANARIAVRIGGGAVVHYGFTGGHGTACGTVGKPGVAVRPVKLPVTCSKCLRNW